MQDETWRTVPVTRFRAADTSPDRTILYFHGGSYIYGSAKTTHVELLAHLALATRYAIIAPSYRLAPEHVYPAQLEDACAVYDELIARSVAAQSIVVMGDSASGNLAFYLQRSLIARGARMPRALVLLSPWSDLTMPGESFSRNDPYDYGTRSVLLEHARLFGAGIAPDDRRLSPVKADPRSLGTTMIVVDLCGSQLIGMAQAMEVDEALDPVNVRFFGAPAAVTHAQCLANFVEEPGALSDVWHESASNALSSGCRERTQSRFPATLIAHLAGRCSCSFMGSRHEHDQWKRRSTRLPPKTPSFSSSSRSGAHSRQGLPKRGKRCCLWPGHRSTIPRRTDRATRARLLRSAGVKPISRDCELHGCGLLSRLALKTPRSSVAQ